MKILFFVVHPAGYHFVKHLVRHLIVRGHQVKFLIVKKDVLEELVAKEAWDYENIFPEGRRDPNLPILVSTIVNLFKTEARLFRRVRDFKPDMMMCDDGTLAHVGRWLDIPCFIFNEDDVFAVWEHNIVYPFAQGVIVPDCCDIGLWKKKKIGYEGYHELAYLHPKYFTPDYEVVKKFLPRGGRYFLLRLAELRASHDIGRTGINADIANNIIKKLAPHGRVFINAERPLEPGFETLRLPLKSTEVFHAMAFADMYIGDSQTMAAEAAVLGTPSLRFNDFVGQLSYLEELEHKYQLTFGIKTSDEAKLYHKIDELLKTPNIKKIWQERKQKLLEDKIDVSEFLIGLFDNLTARHNHLGYLRKG